MSKLNEQDLQKLSELFQMIWIQLNEKELLEEGLSLINLTKFLSSNNENYGDK